MSVSLTADLLATLAKSGLIEAADLALLTEWVQETKPPPAQLVREVRHRKLLTDYQLKEVSRGRAANLVIGPYRLLGMLGEGGMGQVFKARHLRLGRDVAIKLIRPEKLGRPRTVARFDREIRAASQLSHPNVLLAIDAGDANGVHYFAMELVEGTDLARVVETDGALPIKLACDYAMQAALGLQHAHDCGLVHRDIKPSNLLVTPRGQVKIADLGLALLNDLSGDDNRMTNPNLVLGTPDFLAPEQAQKPLEVDGRADVYALGATLYYLLTGRTPYDGPTPTDKMVQHITAPVPVVSEARSDAPPELDAVVQWLMAKSPEDRPPSAAAAAAALAPLARGTPVAAPTSASSEHSALDLDFSVAAPPVAERRRPPATRHVPVFSLALVALMILAIGGAGVFFLSGPPRSSEVSMEALPESFTGPAGVKLVKVPGGVMPGSTTSQSVPGPFYVGVTEVTNAQFQLILGRSPAIWPKRLRQGGSVPVDSVTWSDAAEFCSALNTRDPKPPLGWVYRLPTELEWEFAARAGRAEPFSSGAKLVLGVGGIFDPEAEPPEGGLGEPDITRGRMERGLPYPVPASEPNGFGLCDCHGNVWEWCQNTFAADAAPGAFRAARGGSWREPAKNCQATSRRGLAPDSRCDDVGFRVVLAPAN